MATGPFRADELATTGADAVLEDPADVEAAVAAILGEPAATPS